MEQYVNLKRKSTNNSIAYIVLQIDNICLLTLKKPLGLVFSK